MKKSIILVLTLVMGLMFGANAQKTISGFRKGSKFTEGSFSYSKTSDGTMSSSISPNTGMFITSRFAVGLGTELSDTKTSGGVFGRCYFMDNGRCKVYSQLDVRANLDKNPNGNTRSNSANLGVGLNYFINEKLALSTSLTNLANYTMYPVHGTVTQPSISVGINSVTNPLVAPSFGLFYRF